MTHMRYWAMTFAVAIGGAFLAIQRFAFAPRADRGDHVARGRTVRIVLLGADVPPPPMIMC